jgi:hypothetical protein
MNQRTESVFNFENNENSTIEIGKSQGILFEKSNNIITTNFNNDILVFTKKRFSKAIFHITPDGSLKYGEIPTDTDFLSNIFKQNDIKDSSELILIISKSNPNNEYIKKVFSEELKKKYKIIIKEITSEFNISLYYNSKTPNYLNIIGFIDKNKPKIIHEKLNL